MPYADAWQQVGFLAMNNAASVEVHGASAYVAAEGVLRIVDITAPSDPNLLGSYTSGYGTMATFVVNDGYAYLALLSGLFEVPGEMEVVDVRAPGNPMSLGHYTIAVQSDSELVVEGGLAHIATGDGYEIVDVSDPSNMQRVNLFQGNWLHYYANGLAYLNTRSIWDVSDPFQAKPAMLWPDDYLYLISFTENERVFAGDGIYDLSDPPDPHEKRFALGCQL